MGVWELPPECAETRGGMISGGRRWARRVQMARVSSFMSSRIFAFFVLRMCDVHRLEAASSWRESPGPWRAARPAWGSLGDRPHCGPWTGSCLDTFSPLSRESGQARRASGCPWQGEDGSLPTHRSLLICTGWGRPCYAVTALWVTTAIPVPPKPGLGRDLLNCRLQDTDPAPPHGGQGGVELPAPHTCPAPKVGGITERAFLSSNPASRHIPAGVGVGHKHPH